MAERLLQGPGLAVLGVLVGVPLAYAAAASPTGALAGLAAAIAAALVVLRVEALLLVLVAALPWEGALDFPSESVSVVKILGVLLFAGWILQAASGTLRVQFPEGLIPIALFGFAIGLSLLFSPDPADGMVKALRYVLFIVFVFLVIQIVVDRTQVKRILRVFVLSAAVAAAWALFRFLIVGDVPRAAGPITDPNDFGYLEACALPLAGYLLVSERAARPLWALCFALMCGAVLASLSRGALVGLGGLLLWALLTRRVPIGGAVLGAATVLAVGALALVIWSPVINDRLASHNKIAEQNVDTRIAFWSGAIRMWEDRPLTGVGVGRFGVEAPNYVRNSRIVLDRPVTHNAYLEILAESGLIGLIAFGAFLMETWGLLARAIRTSRARLDADGSRLATAMQGTLVVAMVSGTFISAEVTMPFWMIGALAVVVAGTAAGAAHG
ncbi:MAG TPA: O-antigen ligase family protein [Solirubrobacter sp.]|nr:O-antigen ligase family protein [Solirubrobacter sp.]